MPVAFDEVTDDMLRRSEIVHLVDPADRTCHRFIPCRPRPPADAGQPALNADALDVAVDPARAEEQAQDLRRRIRLIHGPAG